MARQRKLTPEKKTLLRQMRENYNPQDANDVQEMLKDLQQRAQDRRKRHLRLATVRGARFSPNGAFRPHGVAISPFFVLSRFCTLWKKSL